MARDLPTGAKAMGAVSFAVVGWLLANAYVPNMPDAATVGYLREMVALLGVVIGYSVMGNSVGKTYVDSIAAGWKTAIVLIFYALLLSAVYEMLMQSVRMAYDGAWEAFLDVFNRMIERSGPLLSVGVISVAAIGGAIAGMLTENANRRWR